MLLPSPGHEGVSDAAEISPIFPQGTSVGAARAPRPGPQATEYRDFSRRIEDEIPFLRRAARRWQREKADVDDLVQDTLAQALANQHLWQPGSNLRGWLYNPRVRSRHCSKSLRLIRDGRQIRASCG